jgi:hypothetical protein
VKNKIKNIKNQTDYYDNWLITDLEDGLGSRLNMDLFSVKITNMPDKSPGVKYTPAELFDYFRKNINSFVEGSTFTPIEDNYYNIHETALWNSSNPLGALIHIHISLDDGTVVCSDYSTSSWIFSTVKAPLSWSYDGIHPVAGNRQFGYSVDANGNMTIYTRGVDRVSHNYSDTAKVLNYIIESTAFIGADSLWSSMQSILSNFVNTKNGSASIITPTKYRPNWNAIKGYIKGKTAISSLGCH